MSLPTPNLDDRTWQDIVEEAKKIIPAFCPHWTDFNPSDPGMTLVELMAWMMEMLLYRLNRVPDKNYIKFMELMGIRLKAPRPATTWLVFDPAEGAPADLLPQVPANTPVSGVDSAGNTVTFETQEPMNLNNARLVAVYTRINERSRDWTADITSPAATAPIDLFDVQDEIPHALYLSDSDLAHAADEYHFCILTGLDISIPPLHTAWSYWDGADWREVIPLSDETEGFSKSGALKFPPMQGISEREFQGITGYWLRVEISHYIGGPLPAFEQFKKFMEIKSPAGIMPDTGFVSTKDIPFMPVIFGAVFMPFGREANPGDAFYIGSHVLADKGETISLQINLADTYKPLPAAELSAIRILWEYYSEKGEWVTLGIASPQGAMHAAHGFIDRTEAFTRSGKVSFKSPPDIAQLELAGEMNYWLRVSIKEGRYGEKKTLNPPICRDIFIQYKDTPADFTHYITYNNYTFRQMTPFQDSKELFEPFIPVNREHLELFLAFDRAFTNKLHGIYFSFPGENGTPPPVRWEYYHPGGWKVLNLVQDDTLGLSRAGQVSLMGPHDWQSCSLFGREAHWLAVRWLENPGAAMPKLRGIHLNAVKAIHAVSHKEEIMGSSNGQPFQRFHFINVPVLPGPQILVRELVSSIPQEIEAFKKHISQPVIEETDPITGAVTALWVLWEERANFYPLSKFKRIEHFPDRRIENRIRSSSAAGCQADKHTVHRKRHYTLKGGFLCFGVLKTVQAMVSWPTVKRSFVIFFQDLCVWQQALAGTLQKDVHMLQFEIAGDPQHVHHQVCSAAILLLGCDEHCLVTRR